MMAHHPGMEVVEVPDQGHVPFFEGELLLRVARFVAACETAQAAPAPANSRSAV
jgi:hypothetical protein